MIVPTRDDAAAILHLALADGYHRQGARLRWAGELDEARPILRQAIIEGNLAMDYGKSGDVCRRAVAVTWRALELLDGLRASSGR